MDNGAEQEILDGQARANGFVAKDGLQDVSDLLDKASLEKVLYIGDKGDIVDSDECRAERRVGTCAAPKRRVDRRRWSAVLCKRGPRLRSARERHASGNPFRQRDD